MHIPDGYLSPSTCASLYAASAPFWYVALRRVKQVLSSRTVPLLSVFSAFSFVTMMFNLPLPGGTTGHAVGMGVAAIVVGPWFSLLAISTALLIQALLFGDGGITTFGANCFNMAAVGSFAAYAVYRAVARKSALTSVRRVVAGGLAGYAGINLAALCAAIEFGLQPRFFHDAAGAPLYAPYPLHIAVPAMLLGHLTFAGLAELILTGGVVAYLQRSDPSLLRATSGRVPEGNELRTMSMGWLSSRKMWLLVGSFLVLTPLGILAAGTAWGEWRISDFKDIAVPSGLRHLSSIWHAPLAGYAPELLNAGIGYFLSALAGVGAIILLASFAAWLAPKLGHPARIRPGFLEKSINSLLRASEEAIFAERIACSEGLLQRLDPRVKLAGLGALIISAVTVRRLSLSAILFLFSILLVWLSRIPLRVLAIRVWLAVLMFTGAIALPALFLTHGTVLAWLPLLAWPVTKQGLTSAAFLLLRAETAATLALVLLLTTGWSRLLRALRLLRVPVSAVIVLEMTYRYIFVLLQSAHDLFESRRTRLLGPPDPSSQRVSASSIAGALLGKSIALSQDIYLAMEARGFRGEVRLLDDLSMNASDWLYLSTLLLIATLAVWAAR